MLDARERKELLQAARAAIAARLAGGRFPVQPAAGGLAMPRGAFVSLHERGSGELRGCIGSITARETLLDTVVEAAVAAATRDERFAPVQAAELAGLRIDISALTPLYPIESDEVEAGKHGLLVRYGGRSGLLLPQVAVEHGWDSERLLRMTCRKAGLPEDTWHKPGCELQAFEAEVFGD